MVLQINSKTEEQPLWVTPLFPTGDKFLGVDVARMGSDETVLLSLNRYNKEKLKMIDMQITKKTYLTQTVDDILIADKKYKYRKIYIDDGGIGSGVFDFLLREEQTKNKVVAINNSARPLDRDDKRKKKILKEDLYANLLRLMEQGKVQLWNDDRMYLSLKSVQYEYTDEGNFRIFGNYTHITEALIRAAWCMTDKTLNIYCYY